MNLQSVWRVSQAAFLVPVAGFLQASKQFFVAILVSHVSVMMSLETSETSCLADGEEHARD